MDRFIDYACGIDKDVETNLKSNMDRFIDFCNFHFPLVLSLFKIQYG